MNRNYFVIRKVREEDNHWWEEGFNEPEDIPNWNVTDGYLEIEKEY